LRIGIWLALSPRAVFGSALSPHFRERKRGVGLVNIPTFLCLDGKGSDEVLAWWSHSVDMLQVFKLSSFRTSVMPCLTECRLRWSLALAQFFISSISSLIGGEVYPPNPPRHSTLSDILASIQTNNTMSSNSEDVLLGRNSCVAIVLPMRIYCSGETVLSQLYCLASDMAVGSPVGPSSRVT